MDIDTVRSKFIQDNLRRALQEDDRERAQRAAFAFRNYYEWFADRLSEREKAAISSQLALLEKSFALQKPTVQ